MLRITQLLFILVLQTLSIAQAQDCNCAGECSGKSGAYAGFMMCLADCDLRCQQSSSANQTQAHQKRIEPSDTFHALKAGNWGYFSNIPTYRIKGYIGAALGALDQRCQIKRDFDTKRVVEAVVYQVKIPEQKYGIGGTLTAFSEMISGNIKIHPTDAGEDVQAFVTKTDCNAKTHDAWVNNAIQALSDPHTAGTIPNLQQLCQSIHQKSTADCVCFANSFDLEMTPSQKSQFLKSSMDLTAIQSILRQGNMNTLTGYKCSRPPNFFSSDIMLSTLPSIPPNWSAKAGRYDVSGISTKQRRKEEYSGHCDISVDEKKRHAFSCSSGLRRGTGAGLVQGDTMLAFFGGESPCKYKRQNDETIVGECNDGAMKEILTWYAATPRAGERAPLPPRRQAITDERQRERCESAQRAFEQYKLHLERMQERATRRSQAQSANIEEMLSKRQKNVSAVCGSS